MKDGNEAVFVAMLPDLKLGVALKIDDGAFRAAEVLMFYILEKYGVVFGQSVENKNKRPQVLNRRKIQIGQICISGE